VLFPYKFGEDNDSLSFYFAFYLSAVIFYKFYILYYRAHFKTILQPVLLLHRNIPAVLGLKPADMVDKSESTYYATSDQAVTDTITFNLGKKKTFDVLMLQEVIKFGHRTTDWSVDYSSDSKDWMPIPEATGKQSVGYKWLVKFKPITASKVRLRVTSGKACLAIHTLGIYKQPSLQ